VLSLKKTGLLLKGKQRILDLYLTGKKRPILYFAKALL
jgi:hypothetical protein